jgi:hypothetical protein
MHEEDGVAIEILELQLSCRPVYGSASDVTA